MSKEDGGIKNKLPKFGKKDEHKTEREKLDDRREQILAQGRKFKYPMQFAKHRLVIITIVIAVVALILSGVLGWYALYKSQSTSDILYRLTTVLPISVAKIDGENVRYSDYLLIYRSSVTPIEQQNGTLSIEGKDEETVKNAYKRVALDKAENYTYAQKLARQLDVNVTDSMIDESFDNHRKVGGADRNKESFLKVLKDNFNLTEAEYRRMLYLSLVEVEVAKKIDTAATKKAESALEKLKQNGGDFKAVSEELGIEMESTGGLVDVMNIDGGRASKAYEMTPGQISDIFVSLSGDAYYIVRLNDKSDAKVNYDSLKIPFTEFDNRLKNVREENRIEEYIEIPTSDDEAEELLDTSVE